MYLIKITGTNRYYRRLGNQVHQYVGIEDATVFRKWKQAKQKAVISTFIRRFNLRTAENL